MPVSSTKIETGALSVFLAAIGLLARLGKQHAQSRDVALGDAIGRIERERSLVVLAGLSKLAHLPISLGQTVLRLGVRTQLEDALVDLGGLLPLGGSRRVDGLFGQLPLETGCVDRRAGPPAVGK